MEQNLIQENTFVSAFRVGLPPPDKATCRFQLNPLSLSNLPARPDVYQRISRFPIYRSKPVQENLPGKPPYPPNRPGFKHASNIASPLPHALFLKGAFLHSAHPLADRTSLFGLLSATRDALGLCCSLSDRVSLFGLTDATRKSILHSEPFYLKSFNCSKYADSICLQLILTNGIQFPVELSV